MKIALPYNIHFGEYNQDVVVGGIEKFCHQIVETFDDVHIININNKEPIKDNTTKIKNFAKDINANIIISNWHQASFSGAKMLDSEVPIMFINHGHCGLVSILSTMKNLNKHNHSCYMVSKSQHEWYRSMAKRLDTDDVIVDGYINSSYVKGSKPEIMDIEYDCCTIGRCDPIEKKPFILKNWLCDTEFKTILMTNKPNDDKELNYLNKNSHWDGVLFGLNHKDVMKTLSKSMTYFSTCSMEAWGITALEALSHGVPIILNSKNFKHASTDICSDKSHYKLVSDSSELIDAIKSFKNVNRNEIQDMTWEKHLHINCKKTFENAIDSTIEKYDRLNLSKFWTPWRTYHNI